jgi:anti-anti-sigma factor
MGVTSKALRIQLVRDEFGRPPPSPRSIGSEPPHTGHRLPAGITMTESFAFPTNPRSLTKRPVLRFDTQWMTSAAAIVSVRGDIDSTNASALTDYALVEAVCCRCLVLDLSGLKFCGTEGFSALHSISVRCADADIGWMLVPSAAVSRLLQICDPDGSLPVVDSVSAALANLRAQPYYRRPAAPFVIPRSSDHPIG